MSRGHWIVLSSLAFAEVVSALYLASINPAQGYDETWYLLNALHIRGVPSLPYHCNRPPMLPLLLAAFGPYYYSDTDHLNRYYSDCLRIGDDETTDVFTCYVSE